MDFIIRSIGIIHSPFTEKSQTPIQPTHSQTSGWLEVFSDFADGLDDIEGLSHLILLYGFHQSAGYSLHVKPFLDDHLHGVFATRHPCRPNPIGLSIVRLLGRRGNILDIVEVDILDGTPLLDIKPYVPDFDLRAGAPTGWYETCTQRRSG